MLTTDWLTDRLPDDAIAMMRSPGRQKTWSLRKVAMLSTPALVRVSANMTRPSRTRIPLQEVMTCRASAGVRLLRYSEAVGTGAMPVPAALETRHWFSTLCLARGLVDANLDRQRLAGTAVAHAANRRRAEV